MSEAREKAWKHYRDVVMRHWPRRQLRRREFRAGWDAALAERQDLPDREQIARLALMDAATSDSVMRVARAMTLLGCSAAEAEKSLSRFGLLMEQAMKSTTWRE